MEFVLALLSLLIVAAVSVMALRQTGGDFVLSPANVFMLLYVVFHFPLLFAIETSFGIYATAINLGLVSFLAGAILADRGINPKESRSSVLQRPIYVSSDATIWVLLVMASLISFGFFRGLPPSFMILVDALSGKNVLNSLLQMSSIRAELTKSHYFGGGYSGQGAFKLFNEMVWQLIVAYMYMRALVTKKWGQFFVAALIGALVILGAGAKGPVAFIAITVVVARSFVFKIPLTQLVRYGAVLVCILVLVQLAQVSRISSDNDSGVLANAATTISNRVVAGNGLNTFHLIDLLDSGTLTHQNGRDHFVKIMNSLPGIQFEMPYAHILFWEISENRSVNKTTYSTYTYLGASYLDFKLYGVVFLSAIAGAILQFLFRMLMKLRWSTFNIAFAAMLTTHLGQLVAGNLMSLPATLFAAAIIFIIGSLPTIFGKGYSGIRGPLTK